MAVVAAAIVILCAVGIDSSVRRLVAENGIADPTLESLERAVRLTPQNSTGWVRLGRTQARLGAPAEQTITYFQKAVEVSPYDAEAWIALAIQVELSGRPGLAEQHLLKAFSIDNGYESRWNLANFYLRQGRIDEFWHWIRKTIAFAPRGFQPAVQLCWRAFDDAQLILDNGIPDIPAVNRLYFAYLMETKRLEAATQTWNRIEGELTADLLGTTFRYIGYLLQARQVSEAVRVWNRICHHNLVPYQPLSPASGPLLTNAGFQFPPSGRGFDWRLLEAAGIDWEINNAVGSQGEIVFSFSGMQDRSSALLEQSIPVESGSVYRFEFTYSTQGLPDETGVRWSVFDALESQLIAQTSPLEATPEPKRGSLVLKAGTSTRLVRLVLEYERGRGTTRKDGVLRIGALSLRATDAVGGRRSG